VDGEQAAVSPGATRCIVVMHSPKSAPPWSACARTRADCASRKGPYERRDTAFLFSERTRSAVLSPLGRRRGI
jgi:hypothetical protein